MNNANINNIKQENLQIAVIGLGYVGLPLAVALKKHFHVVGFDISKKRLEQIKANIDINNEVSPETLSFVQLLVTNEINALENSDIYIITVPTPINSKNEPDIEALTQASKTVGKVLKNGAIVVYESTVYPGVTENICGKILEKASGLIAGVDFFLGYSPERINPGDKVHTVEKITKVIAGQTSFVVQQLQKVYGAINNNNLFIAKNIKTAEAAKVIENTQRDINIAFINEVTTIVNKLGLSMYDVLDAASTKWNFLQFNPGLVGGHCIGVDPYYLAHCALEQNIEPQVILAGRKINESMSKHVATMIDAKVKATCAATTNNISNTSNTRITNKYKILILGLTFKENIPDLRNTKVFDLTQELQKLKYEVDVHDPRALAEDAYKYYDIKLVDKNFKNIATKYNCIIGAVAHTEYQTLQTNDLLPLLTEVAVLADIKRMWQNLQLPDNIHYVTL